MDSLGFVWEKKTEELESENCVFYERTDADVVAEIEKQNED